MAMPQQNGTVAGPVVDQLVPVHVPLVRPSGPLDVDREWLQVTQIVRDAVEKERSSLFVQAARASELGLESFGQRVQGCDGLRHRFLLVGRGGAQRGRAKSSNLPKLSKTSEVWSGSSRTHRGRPALRPRVWPVSSWSRH